MRKFFTLLVLLPLMAVSVSAQSTKRGDINGDGVVDISDVVTLVNIILNGDENESYLTCPDDHHPHLIDLGLPSGTKWACCNVDADAPESYGGYYAWGETTEKDVYDWSTYTHCDGSSDLCHNLGSNIAGSQYDVAHVKWGGIWQMPTKDQLDELKTKCTSKWTMLNGVSGYEFTGSNGGYIFLPAAGRHWYSELYDDGSDGYYWSSTSNEDFEGSAYSFYFYEISAYRDDYDRLHGLSVRPVSK